MTQLPSNPDESLLQGQIPRHVAIIMDGNGRWARQKHLPRHAGHREGVKSVRRIVEACKSKGIQALTLFAFSSENWRRPQKEVGLLMELFLHTLKKEINRLDRNGVQLRFIGDRSAFPEKLQELMNAAESQTKENRDLILSVAANYGGRWDISQAAQRLAERVAQGTLSSEQINEEMMSAELSLADIPEPDLFIRTGGEQRISNFLLWQLAYTELYFTDTLWPDFHTQAFEEALASFAGRQRRFGRTGEQVEQLKGA